MSHSETFHSDRAPAAVGPYSQAIAPVGPGRPVYLSGQIGLNPATKDKPTLAEGGVEAEARQAFANVKAVLAAAGLELSDVLSVDVLLADMADFAAVNKIYAEEFGDHRPARAAYQAAGLPLGAKIEIKAIAWQAEK
jgi:2-iminobutanoate/2-iminopropanoate deaminase